MCNAMQHIIKWLCLSSLLCASISCGKEMDVPDTPGMPSDGEMMLHIGFKVPTRAAAEGYEDGDTNENYIDIAGGNYRIYFFDTDDRFIARFEPDGVVATEGTDCRQYHLLGKAPDALIQHGAFKMVMLANWPKYGDTAMKAGVTTIDDVCSADWAQYTYKPTFNLDPQNGTLMPFYGVREYSGVSFRTGQATLLDEPVTLLRAMAKVEVILETDEYFNFSFSQLRITRYNAKGYCAPMGVYSQADYDHNGAWDEDYVRTLHLVNGQNDSGSKEIIVSKSLEWKEEQPTGEAKVYRKWTVYLPEYQNIGAGNNYSRIRAQYNIESPRPEWHEIYFAKYVNGKTNNNDDAYRLNIERNNIYRFHVKCTGYQFKLLLDVSDWEGLYNNQFEFGDGQITSPVAPWEDEATNEFEF